MEQKKIKAIIENLLLISDQPVTLDKISETFDLKYGKDEIKSAIKDLTDDYSDRNLQIQEVAGGYQLCTRIEYSDWIKKFYKLDKRTKLSPAALDTLSIIAYKQPMTRAEVEDIRGVDSGGVIKTLFEKKLLRLMGRKKVIGRPILYGTSNNFLEYFGLRNISELPTLREFMDKSEEDSGVAVQTDLPFEEEERADSEEEAIKNVSTEETENT